MKEQRHKRKEIYSVLVVSNISSKSRQFSISRNTVRVLIYIAVLLFLLIGGLIWWTVVSGKQVVSLQKEIDGQAESLESWEKEKEELSNKNQELEAEVAALRQEQAQDLMEEQEEAEAEEAEAAEAVKPGLYPSSGVGSLTATYSEDHRYISISTYNGGDIIAAGDGTVESVSNNDDYKHVIVVAHEGGYKTFYLYDGDAEVKVEQGAQVKSGDVLFTVSEDGINLDYQVLLGEEAIDPFLVIDAEG